MELRDQKADVKKKLIDILIEFRIISDKYTGQIVLNCHQGATKELIVQHKY